MTTADASLRILSLLWQASWQGALFAVAVGLVCLLFRIPAPVRAWLWFLAGVKFCGGFLYLLLSGRGMALEVPVPNPLIPSVSLATAVQVVPFSSLAPWVMTAWVTGVLLCVTLIIIRIRATYKTMSAALPCSTETVPTMLSVLSSQIGIAPDHVPAVCIAPQVAEGPQVMLSRSGSVVILPESLLPPSPAALNEADLRFVIAHELAHIRRGDLWAGLLFAGMQTLFFFHPGAIWVKREWEATREEACDLLALRACADGDRDSAAHYGALLLRLGSGTTINSVVSARIAASPFTALRRRLTHLQRHQTETEGRFSFAFALIALPVLTALLLPLEPRWTTKNVGTRAAVVAPQHAPSAHILSHPVSLVSAPIHPHPPQVTISKVAQSIIVRKKVYPSVFVANSVPVAVPTPTPRRLFAPLRRDTVVSVPVKPVLSIQTESSLEANAIAVEPPETASMFAPIPIEPEIAHDLAEHLLSRTVADAASDTATSASLTARSSDTVSARTAVAALDTKGAPRSGPVPASLESTRSRSIPTSAVSPSTTPSETPFPASDITRAPRN